MGIVLARIDQRLIHGIVVTQWAGYTKAQRLMVIDDELSQDELRKTAMRMSKPAGTGMSIISIQRAITNFQAGKYDDHNVFVIVNEPQTLIPLLDAGIAIPEVNVGILFAGTDKTQISKMVAVNEAEVMALRELERRQVPVTLRYVPSDPNKPIEDYLKQLKTKE